MLTLEFGSERRTNIFNVGVADHWQENLQPALLRRLLLFTANQVIQLGKARLKLQTLGLFGFVLGGFALISGLLDSVDFFLILLISDHLNDLLLLGASAYQRQFTLALVLYWCDLIYRFLPGSRRWQHISKQVRLYLVKGLLQRCLLSAPCKVTFKLRHTCHGVRRTQVGFALACLTFFTPLIFVEFGAACNDRAVRHNSRSEWRALITKQLLGLGALLFLTCGWRCLFCVRTKLRATCFASDGHVDNQTCQCTDTCAIRTFLAGTHKNLLAWVVYALGDQVLRNLLSGFCCTFNTTPCNGSTHDALERLDLWSQDVEQAGRRTELCSQASFFACSAFGFSGFSGFTCTCGNTKT